MTHILLQPVIVLVLWSFVMWAWLYAVRIPAVKKAKVTLRSDATKAEFDAQMPPSVRWKADNYNHLMEQPTLFYAVALAFTFAGGAGSVDAGLAWLYVALRIVHSLVQSIGNPVMVRFSVFMASSVVLLVLTVRAALAVFGGA